MLDREVAAHLIDVVPTVLDVAGLAREPALPGLSLLGPLPPSRTLAGLEPPLGYVVRWPQKWVRWNDRAARVDLLDDPGERNGTRVSLSEYEAARAGLELAPVHLSRAVPIEGMTEEDAASLRALGYGGDVESH